MAILNAYFARRSLAAFRDELSDSVRRLAADLVALFNDDGTAPQSDVIRQLFPLSTPRSARPQLARLRDLVNSAASPHGVRLVVDQDLVFFEALLQDPGSIKTGELDAIPEKQLVKSQRGLPVENYPVVVLLTFNEHESKAVVQTFCPAAPPAVETRNEASYNLLGIWSGMKIVHRISRQGEGHAQLSASEAIGSWRPRAVIAVGIAFGVNSQKQQIGDVLVSEYILGYELSRVNADASIVLRGGKESSSTALLDRFIHVDHMKKADPASALHWPTLRFGTVLSGNKLVDNISYRASLLEHEPHAEGGEMEAVGLQLVSDRKRVDWIVVKAICDWADGKKNISRKDQDQRLAARNAALVVRAALEVGPIYMDVPSLPAAHPLDAERVEITQKFDLLPPSATEMNLRDSQAIPHSRWVRDTKGAPTSLRKDAKVVDQSDRGVEVLPYMLDWVDADDAPPLFALLGEYGMGKTITSQRFAQLLDERRQSDLTQPIPLYFDLRFVTGLDRRIPTLRQTIEECMSRGWQTQQGRKYILEDVYEWIARGAVLIFDGLDEVLVKLKESDGQVFTRNLLRIVLESPRKPPVRAAVKVIVTCRTHYFRTLRDQRNHFTGQERAELGPESFRALVLLPLTDEQVEAYLRAAIPSANPERLVDVVRSVNQLEELTQRPYTLKLVAEFIPEIESDRAEGRPVYGSTIYRRMVSRWLERDSGKHHIRAEHKMRLAAHLAAHFWRSGTSLMSAQDIEAWFHLWLQGQADINLRYRTLHPDQLEEDLRTATFLTRVDDDSGASKFRFAHTSLQEYFLARYLVSGVEKHEIERWCINLPSRETLEFVGQIFAELGETAKFAHLRTLELWKSKYHPVASELVFKYAMTAVAKRWPAPALRGFDLARANLADLTFRSDDGVLDLSGTSFEGADLRRSSLCGAILRDVNFRSANISWSTWDNCEVARSSFESALLIGSTFRRCDFTSADLQEADVSEAEFIFSLGLERFSSGEAVVVPLGGGATERVSAELSWVRPSFAGIGDIKFSPSGSYFASAGHGNAMRLWNPKSGRVTAMVTVRTGELRCCAWLTDAVVVAGGSNGSIHVWRPFDDSRVSEYPLLSGDILACAAVADSLLMVASRTGEIALYELPSGALRFKVIFQGGAVVGSLALSPDRSVACALTRNGVLNVWDTLTGRLRFSWDGLGHQKLFEDDEDQYGVSFSDIACWSPNGEVIACGTSEGSLWVWDAVRGALVYRWQGHSAAVISCRWVEGGTKLCTLDIDGNMLYWAPAAWNLERSDVSSYPPLRRAVWSLTGSDLLVNDFGGRIIGFDCASGSSKFVIDDRADISRACAWDPDGRLLASTDEAGTLRVWLAESGECLQTIPGREVAWVCRFLANGALVLRGDVNAQVEVFETLTGRLSSSFMTSGRMIWDACVMPDGRELLVSIGEEGVLGAVSLLDGSVSKQYRGLRGEVYACAVSPDGRHIAAIGSEDELAVWESARSRHLWKVELGVTGPNDCQWSLDGLALATGGDDGTVRIWDAADGSLLGIIKAHSGRVFSCVWGPGSLLITAGQEGTIRVWDATSGSLQNEFEGHEGRVIECALSPDAKWLASVGDDCTLRVWDVFRAQAHRIFAVSAAGYASWDPQERRVLHLAGDAWKWLGWMPLDDPGRRRLPAEAFVGTVTAKNAGPVVQ